MARPRSIDRDRVLDVAERIVSEHGAGALTIGGVAEAAGISKGGVQSSFGTKEALIAAMLGRWMEDEGRRFAVVAGEHPSPARRLQSHLDTTQHEDLASQKRMASMLAALVQSPEHLAETRDWYARRIGPLGEGRILSRSERIAFLAAEGAFYLRFLGLMPMDAATWDEIFADLGRMIEAKNTPPVAEG